MIKFDLPPDRRLAFLVRFSGIVFGGERFNLNPLSSPPRLLVNENGKMHINIIYATDEGRMYVFGFAPCKFLMD
jgi:hypothetical protein